jgi:hypothetical protein
MIEINGVQEPSPQKKYHSPKKQDKSDDISQVDSEMLNQDVQNHSLRKINTQISKPKDGEERPLFGQNVLDE